MSWLVGKILGGVGMLRLLVIFHLLVVIGLWMRLLIL